MGLGYLPHNCQPKARASGLPRRGPVSTPEALKHPLLVLGAEARTVIKNRHPDHLGVLTRSHPHTTGRVRDPDGVAQQVRQSTPQRNRVANHGQLGSNLVQQHDSGGSCSRTKVLDRLGHHDRSVNRLAPRVGSLMVGVEQEVVDKG